jgi:hypothetical protein
MGRAAEAIEDQKQEDRRKTAEGVPWWVYLIGMVAVIGFMVMMMFLPQKIALMTGGVILYGAAICVNFYAAVRIIIIAFSESVLQGAAVLIGNFICPIYNLYFIITRWDQCGTYFLMMLATNVVANLVWFSLEAVLGAMGGDEPQGFVPERPPAAVARLATAAKQSSSQRSAITSLPGVPHESRATIGSGDCLVLAGSSRGRRADETGPEDRWGCTGWHAAA